MTARGSAALRVESVAGASAVTQAFATSPMKLLTPRARGTSAWAFSSSFGGGLVAGDQTHLTLTVGERARCYFGTQASTKVYRNPTGKACSHRTQAAVAEDGLLVFMPDPVQAFAGSSYSQRQEFELAPGASLVLLDWFTSGRSARGERWQFERFRSRNDVSIGGRRWLVDALQLDAAAAELGSAHELGRFNCVATLFVAGPQLEAAGSAILKDVQARPLGRRDALIVVASAVGSGTFLRLAGEATESVGDEIRRHLRPVAGLLGDDPWARKW
jgi:urease accessory protein